MVFVSYSHADSLWRARFEITSKPLRKTVPMKFWSDKDMKVGEWESQLNGEMDKSDLAVLLVSTHFLASDYIMDFELPRLLSAHDKRGMQILWALLDPCDVKRFPQITRFQAMKLEELKPMAMLNEWQWKAAMLNGCDMIDEFYMGRERPLINRGLDGKSFPRINKGFQVLAEPCTRESVAFVYSQEGKWWRQGHIKKGSTKTDLYLGGEETKSKTAFRVVVITPQEALNKPSYPNLPLHRTKSDEIMLYRA